VLSQRQQSVQIEPMGTVRQSDLSASVCGKKQIREFGRALLGEALNVQL
jgi:hypothetical protein